MRVKHILIPFALYLNLQGTCKFNLIFFIHSVTLDSAMMSMYLVYHNISQYDSFLQQIVLLNKMIR